MDDVISRQAVISLPVKPKEDRYFQTQNLDDAYDYGWWSLQECIKKLPSTQPEIIRCKDCKYGSPNGKYGRKCYHYALYETHEMKPEDFCSRAERRTDYANVIT